MKTEINFTTLGAQLGVLPPNHEKTETMVEAFTSAHKSWLKATVDARKAQRERAVKIIGVLHEIFEEEGENALPRAGLVTVAMTRLPGVTIANASDVETEVLKALQDAPTVFQLRGGAGRKGITVYRVRMKTGKETGVEVPAAQEAHANGSAQAAS